MSYYRLLRQHPEGKAVRGTLYRATPDGDEFICPTLENLDKMIPALIYRVQVTMSPKFRRLLPLVCQVPGRAGIRVHRGTRPEHSAGCILVPPAQEQLLTARLLLQQQSREEIRLEICQPTS